MTSSSRTVEASRRWLAALAVPAAVVLVGCGSGDTTDTVGSTASTPSGTAAGTSETTGSTSGEPAPTEGADGHSTRATDVVLKVDGTDLHVQGGLACVRQGDRLVIGGGPEVESGRTAPAGVEGNTVGVLLHGGTAVDSVLIGPAENPADIVAYKAGSGVGEATVARDGDHFVITGHGMRRTRQQSGTVPFRIEATCRGV